MHFTQINKIIPEKSNKLKVKNSFEKYKVIKAWHEIVPNFVDQAKEKTMAINFTSGVLVVACLCKDVAYQIKVLTKRIIEELNNFLGKSLVWAIQVEI